MVLAFYCLYLVCYFSLLSGTVVASVVVMLPRVDPDVSAVFVDPVDTAVLSVGDVPASTVWSAGGSLS